MLYSCYQTFGGLIQQERAWVLSRQALDPEFNHEPHLKVEAGAKAVLEDQLDNFIFEENMNMVVQGNSNQCKYTISSE